MHKVLVVDDHELVRLGLRSLIESAEDTQVIGECQSGEEALVSVRELQPDIVFMDIRMPGMGGLEATRRLLVSHPEIKVIVISALSDELYPRQLLKAGVAGYITKSADRHEIADALRTVINDRIYVSPEVAQLIVIKGLSSGQETSPLAKLSQRELQIAQMITNGHRVKEVAGVLNISTKTINSYKYRIFEKLGVSNDVELTLAAVKYGLVDPSDVL